MSLDLRVGDSVWYVPRGYNLAIKCKITEVDDQFRRQHPAGIISYWIDEPVGHSLEEDEFCFSRGEAMKYMQEDPRPPAHLLEYRACRLFFIVSTHNLPLTEACNLYSELWKSYPSKAEGREWFKL